MLQALLVSKDDQSSETLIHVLAELGIAVTRSSAADVAVARLSGEPFDQVIADFEDTQTASLIFENCRRLAAAHRNPPVTVALLGDIRQIRAVLGSDAHFVLTKPIRPVSALATLRAAAAILKRERRKSFRIAVQVPATIHVNEESTVEGILLDLSTGGMDVLAAKPIALSTLVHVSFELPDHPLHVEAHAEVAWRTNNGQLGLRFLDMEARIRERMAEWLKAKSRDSLQDDQGPVGQCKLTDLSLGGCYIETESPFPQSSAVDLCLKATDMEIHIDGLVRVMHPGHGMGIEFPARTQQQRESVGEFIDCLVRHPEAPPRLETSPRALVANPIDLSQGNSQPGDAEDPLLTLLRTGSAMEQEEFLAQLSRQRTCAVGN
ncbi:MAG: PilZ domain-containing protein [Terriglobales bacterium]|jgi:CheY-like chemotaxis protein